MTRAPTARSETRPAIHDIYRTLRRSYRQHQAPINKFIQARTDNPFRVLVATILSARTKDETTAEAAKRLFAVVHNIDELDRLPTERLRRLIYPVGFYRTKAQHLKRLPAILREQFQGTIPDTMEDLCRLPGVGRKTASLVLTDAFGRPAICVDVHVHRISNRLGLVRTRNPLQTEMGLRSLLPKRYWKNWNLYLVSHGQTVCMPLRPKCNECLLQSLCPRIGVV